MKHCLSILIVALTATLSVFAQHVPSDTIVFTATKAVAELDPNNSNYCFTLEGTYNGDPYKLQMDYYADSEFGTFGDTEFRLPSAGGSSTNWIRKDDGKYKTCYGHSISATVANNNGTTSIDLEGLYRYKAWGSTDTTWYLVRVHADILPYAPKTTTVLDLGQVALVPNDFLGYLIMEAENADYRLAFGISGTSSLHAGTFYRTEMIRPDLVNKTTNDTVAPIFAQLEVADSTVSGLYLLTLDIIDADTNLFRVKMHTDVITVLDTVTVACASSTMQDVVSMYGFYQMVGASSDYQVALAVKPGIIRNSELLIPNDSVDLSYTQVLRLSDSTLIRVQQASGYIVVDSSTIVPSQTVFADLIGTNGTLYQVSFPFGGSDLPKATDTVVVDNATVGRVDYTKSAGWLGLVLVGDSVDVHVTLYNGLSMEGNITTDMFDYTESYITTYGDVIRFSDVVAAEMRMDSINDTVVFALDVVTVSSRMYRFVARMEPKFALSGNCSYTLNYNQAHVNMVCLRHEQHTYQLQFQRADSWTDDGEPVGDFEYWTFVFNNDSIDGISGTYGYAAGTLYESVYHMVYEGGTEILLMPMACILNIQAAQALQVELGDGVYYNTHVYSVAARIAAENGLIYDLSGTNFLLCADYETGLFVELTESVFTALEEKLAEQGLRVKKVLRNGVILLESENGTFTIDGKKR